MDESTSRSGSDVPDDEHFAADHPDAATLAELRLTHRVAKMFPDVAKRFERLSGGRLNVTILAAAALVAASLVIYRLRRRGITNPKTILSKISPDSFDTIQEWFGEQKEKLEQRFGFGRKKKDEQE